MTLLYGTTNPAKLRSMRNVLTPFGVELIGLGDLDTQIPDVDENGASPLENARLKAAAYFNAFDIPVFSCDSGLYIDGLPNHEQPGVHVRMINDKRLNDDEMIEYYSKIAEKLGGKAIAQYRNAICFIKSDNEIFESFSNYLWSEPFYIVVKPHEKREEGFPLDSLSVHIASGQYYNDTTIGEFSDVLRNGFQRFFREAL
jgi:8-oxo-dGTP diphosphatase